MAGTAVPGRLTWQLLRVEEKRFETPRVMTIKLASDSWPGHVPGQHIDVRLTAEDGYRAERSYSVASAPAQGWMELTVEDIAEGEVSPYIADVLAPGDMLELRGPIGGYFTWTEQVGGPLLLVGGGSGIVPLMSILRYRQAIGSTAPMTLLVSSRSWIEIIYRDELQALATQPGIRIVHTLTRSQPTDWQGFSRRIDREMIEEVCGSYSAPTTAYVCGPTGMVETTATTLVDLGYPPERVKTERFGPTGR